jgi:type II secretion system protein N
MLGTLGPRTRKAIRYAGFALVGVVTFVFALQLTFPFGRVKDKLIEALSEKYEVNIGSVDGGWLPGRVYFKAVSLRTRPTKADDVATTFYIEQLQLDVGLFALLRGTVAVKLNADIGAGHLRADVAISSGSTVISVVGDDLPSARLPIREGLGLPMSGKLRLAFDLDLPNEKSKTGKAGANWLKADGSASLSCPAGCTVGDGKSKLKVNLKNSRSQAFAEGGIDFGKVNIDTLFANIELKNGKVAITKFETKSPDGELHVDFDMTLNQDLNQSQVTGCLRFNGSDGLRKREPKIYGALSTTGAPLGPDNLFHIKLDGPLRDVRRLGLVCSQASNTDNPGGTGVTARPNLTVTPDAPIRPTPVIPPPAAPAAATQPIPPTPPPYAGAVGSASPNLNPYQAVQGSPSMVGSGVPVPSSSPPPESTGGGPNTVPLPGSEEVPGGSAQISPSGGPVIPPPTSAAPQ